MLKPGDKVRIIITGKAAATVSVVKLVSAGGTVVLKSALDGRRCFEEHELEKVDECHQG